MIKRTEVRQGVQSGWELQQNLCICKKDFLYRSPISLTNISGLYNVFRIQLDHSFETIYLYSKHDPSESTDRGRDQAIFNVLKTHILQVYKNMKVSVKTRNMSIGHKCTHFSTFISTFLSYILSKLYDKHNSQTDRWMDSGKYKYPPLSGGIKLDNNTKIKQLYF